MDKNANSLEHPQEGREELWWERSPKAIDWKNIIIIGMDINKDKNYNRNS